MIYPATPPPTFYSAEPHKCPKCDGYGWLQYDPTMPFGANTSAGPWQCPACSGTGILWSQA